MLPGAVLKTLRYQILPQPVASTRMTPSDHPLTSHKLFSMQQLSYGPGPTAGLTPEPERSLQGDCCPSYEILHIFICNYPEVHAGDALRLDSTTTSPMQTVTRRLAF